MANAQVLRNSDERLQVVFYVDGVPTDPDADAVTVTITRDDGTALASAASAIRLDQGVYAYPLSPQANLDHLTAVWTGMFSAITQSVTTYVDIVGGYYVSLAELRAMKNLDDATKFTAEDLIAARQWFETSFERYTGRAFVPRYKRIVMWGSGGAVMQLPDEYLRSLRTVKFASVDLSSAAIANISVEASGRIQHFWPLGINGPDDSFGVYGSTFPANARITFVYEYGMDACPDDVREAAKTAIRMRLLDDETGRREYALVTDVGVVRYSRPGEDRPFGIEEVDRVANDRRRPGWKADRLTVGSVPIG